MKAVDRLIVKLATRVVVPTHPRVRNGKREIVKTYTYTRSGSAAPEVPDGKKQVAGQVAEADRVRDLVKKAAPSAVGKVEKKSTGGSGTRDDPVRTSDVTEAAKALGEGKYVQLRHKRQVSTLLDKLSEFVNEAKAKGENAPSYDLCRVSVPGTNLFCVESKGIPRVQMPQLSGTPEPGSKADGFEKDKKGEVDLGPEFTKYLRNRGVGVQQQTISAQYLKASQNELDGEKVAAIESLIEKGVIDPTGGGSIFVSNDDYVVDGHHRWAATVAREIESGGDIEMPTQQIDMDIISLLALARRWTQEMGLRPKKAGETTGKPVAASSVDRLRELVALTLVEVAPYPRVRNGKVEVVDGYTYYRRGGKQFLKHVQKGAFAPTDFIGLPPEAEDRAAKVEEALSTALRSGMSSHQQHAVQVGVKPGNGDPVFAWSADRQKLHKQIIDHFYQEKFGNVPSEGKAVIIGGLPGAGKSTLLREHENIDPGQYGTISADDIKEYLASHDLIPAMPELTPMETSPLIHEETSYLTDMLAQRAYDNRKNLIWDITMSSTERVDTMLQDLSSHGYLDVLGMFVDVDPDTSTQRALGRWWGGIEAFRRGEHPLGGRYVPPRAIRQMVSGGGGGGFPENRRVFERLKEKFTRWEVWDARRGFKLVNSSASVPRMT